MRRGSQSRALLLELMIVILFFMLASAVLLELFVTARSSGARAELLSKAVLESQNLAERLYAAPDPEEKLRELGFTESKEGFLSEDGELQTLVSLRAEERPGGSLETGFISVSAGDGELLRLPLSRYEERGT